MFEIGFSELFLVLVIGLLVLGPDRLPIAIKRIAGWLRTLRSLTTIVQHEFLQELQLENLQKDKKSTEKINMEQSTSKLKSSMEELNTSEESIDPAYTVFDSENSKYKSNNTTQVILKK